MRGKFITLEGGEGCGKTTQIALLADALRAEGIEVRTTREPGGTQLGERIRGILKEVSAEPLCDRSELLLFLAARAQLVHDVIAPALARGVWVLSDRFCDSTYAYQGYGRGLPLEAIRQADGFARAGLLPDKTFLLCADPAACRRRMQERESRTQTAADRIEQAGDVFHARLRAGFSALAAADPGRIQPIDANGTVEEVQERIWKALKPLI
ncbi:MAG TPA: dTMP kinase [Verrucomicrobia bacterium]|nr:dTMP kinase [Verrucomicrobiota bacterium]